MKESYVHTQEEGNAKKVKAVLEEQLASEARQNLSERAVASRLEKVGQNELPEKRLESGKEPFPNA